MRKFLIVLLLLIATCSIGVSVYFLVNPEPEGAKRQEIEESLADAYLLHLSQRQAEPDGAPAETGQEAEGLTGEENRTMGEEALPAGNERDAAEDGPKEEPSLSVGEEAGTEEATRAASRIRRGNGEEATSRAATEAATFADTNYLTRDGVTYTPDYARGELIGVLEVPKAKIRRGIYGGTWEDIQYDLDIWMVTEARPDYELGKTHFCIYGHNHTVQDLSFNNLKTVGPGDTFTITTADGEFVYDVTDFFAEWREIVTWDYIDNFNLPADKCYIVTCGRDEYRYKDIVVVGTLRENPLAAGEEESTEAVLESEDASGVGKQGEALGELSGTENESGIEESASGEEGDAGAEEGTKESTAEQEEETLPVMETSAQEILPTRETKLSLSYDAGSLTVRLTDATGHAVDAPLALVDGDGLFIERWMGAEHTVESELTPGVEYLVSAYSQREMPEGYLAPKEVVFSLKQGEVSAQELAPTTPDVPDWARYTIMGLGAVLILMIIALIVRVARRK